MNVKASLALSLFALSAATYADVNSVNTSPSSINVAAKGVTSVNVVWNVNRTETVGAPSTGGPIPRVVSSPSAILQIGGATVATLAGTVSQTSTLSSGQSTTVRINETLSINPALARQIATSRVGNVRVIRTFSDTQRVSSGEIRLIASLGSQGPLAVNRIDLAFENKARTDVIYNGDSVHAIADISFNSSGILKGEWRIVDPSASLGSGGGRVLQIIRQNLVSSGQGRTRIVSPPLPTNSNGLYLVAFAVENGNTHIETPILRYFVLDKKGSTIASTPSDIAVRSPADGAELSSETLFIWNKVNGANAYQVELFNKGDDIPLTGKLVPATDLKLALSAISFEWLEPNHEYNWRVRAFGKDGQLLGQSKFQTIYMP